MIRSGFCVFIWSILLLLSSFSAYSQEKEVPETDKPKIIVAAVVDQMRWDYLYRYYERYTEAGFKRMLKEGFTFENAMISDAVPMDELGSVPWPRVMKSMFLNGFNAKRGGDIALLIQPGWKVGSKSGASHGSWYPYDAHIPLVWMGWNVSSGQSHRKVNMSDIAPTLAAMLKIQMPSGSIGEPLLEIID